MHWLRRCRAFQELVQNVTYPHPGERVAAASRGQGEGSCQWVWGRAGSRSQGAPTPILMDAAGGGAIAIALSVTTPVSFSPSCEQGLDLTSPISLSDAEPSLAWHGSRGFLHSCAAHGEGVLHPTLPSPTKEGHTFQLPLKVFSLSPKGTHPHLGWAKLSADRERDSNREPWTLLPHSAMM